METDRTAVKFPDTDPIVKEENYVGVFLKAVNKQRDEVILVLIDVESIFDCYQIILFIKLYFFIIFFFNLSNSWATNS